jgi:hypothetical protein
MNWDFGGEKVTPDFMSYDTPCYGLNSIYESSSKLVYYSTVFYSAYSTSIVTFAY